MVVRSFDITNTLNATSTSIYPNAVCGEAQEEKYENKLL